VDKPEQVSVSLSKFEQDIVTRESTKRGLYNFSAMVRQIIREWDETHRVAITERGRQALTETPCDQNSDTQ
jgi:hypothetical protein